MKHYYKSVEQFETFLKLTAIALFARCTAQRRSAKAVSALDPWRRLAQEQGFSKLAKKIEEMAKKLPEWRDDAVKNANTTATHDIQTAVLKEVDGFFARDINPMSHGLWKVPF